MKTIDIKTTTVDMQTGETTEGTSQFVLMPPPDPPACQTCGREHDPEDPHDPAQLYYQYAFFGEFDRWPTWKDALAHCAPVVQAHWERELRVRGKWDG